MAVAATGLRCRVSALDELLLTCVQSAADAVGRPVRPLQLQALLQLPRLADNRGYVSVSVAESLVADLATELPGRSEWVLPNAGPSPRLLNFHGLEANRADEVMQRFHYLQSPRTDGRAYGLSTKTGRLVALCVSSPLDVDSLRELLALRRRNITYARVLSRVFAFEGAPNNSISYMLSRAGREEQRLGATDFLTYVNPNMGFTGSSYRASGWTQIGVEPGTKYRYIDDRYITDRELAAMMGKRDDETYQRMLGQRFAVSIMPLEPLLVFQTSLVKESGDGLGPG